MDTRNHTLTVIALSFIGCALVACSKDAPKIPAPEPSLLAKGKIFLNQGWTPAERQEVYYRSFGSRLLDYETFLALEQADNDTLFRDNANMSRLGFITEPSNYYNADGLPVGVTRDSDSKNSWVGFTCAACHTGQATFANKTIRIDGGQSQLNYGLFETELLAALQATYSQPEKWQRFFARMQLRQKKLNAEAVKQKIATRITELTHRYAMNATDVPYGHGRLDAFGQIFNAIAVEALQIPENKRAPDAPTSFPVLWDASHLDVVQWNSSAPNAEPGPLAQNATTALAVYGTVEVRGHSLGYPSSTNIKNLGHLQSIFYKLTAPVWPQSILGKPNANLVAQGEKIYQQQCLQCHSLVDAHDPKRQLMAVSVPVTEVGTDPRMVDNFYNGSVKTGELEGKHFALWFGDKFGAEASRLDVVMHVTAGTLANNPIDSLRAVISEYANNKSAKLIEGVRYYKARPINGIWSSSPYLHNGSVPTVYDLLLPPAQRPAQFYVGNRELDTVKVGNRSDEVIGTSLYDTTLPGNSNAGHEYGTQLPEPERMALLEYIKTL